MSEDILHLAERMATAARRGVAVERMWQQKLEDDQKEAGKESSFELNELSKAS